LIAAIVLSGGKSERMGRPKALLRFRGATFLEHILLAIEKASIDRTVIVVGHHRLEIEAALPGMSFAFNPDYEQGMSTSIQTGIRALPENVSAAVLFLVDHPIVASATIDALIAHVKPGVIVVPVHAGRRGHPVVFTGDVLEEILRLGPEEGANVVVRKDPRRVIEVAVDDPGVLLDIDTAQQFAALVAEEPPEV
jgi:molybdenum cofactor cytidylyltransferase